MGWIRMLWEESEEDTTQEYRRDVKRRGCSTKIDLWVNGNIIIGSARDVGINSLGITCRQHIGDGKIFVRPAYSEDWIEMNVIHCTQTVSGFKIGLTEV